MLSDFSSAAKAWSRANSVFRSSNTPVGQFGIGQFPCHQHIRTLATRAKRCELLHDAGSGQQGPYLDIGIAPLEFVDDAHPGTELVRIGCKKKVNASSSSAAHPAAQGASEAAVSAPAPRNRLRRSNGLLTIVLPILGPVVQRPSGWEVPNPIDPVAAPRHVGEHDAAPVVRRERHRDGGSGTGHLGPASPAQLLEQLDNVE